MNFIHFASFSIAEEYRIHKLVFKQQVYQDHNGHDQEFRLFNEASIRKALYKCHSALVQ